jgi:hypothetical protein
MQLPSLTADYHQFLLKAITTPRLVQDPSHVGFLIDQLKFWHLSKAEYLVECRFDKVEGKVNSILELWLDISPALRQTIDVKPHDGH